MRVKTNQEQTFADSFINIPNSQLDTINKIIDWKATTHSANDSEMTCFKENVKQRPLHNTLKATIKN